VTHNDHRWPETASGERGAAERRSAAPGKWRRPAGRSAPRKPVAAELGLDLSALDWRHSGDGPGALEVAMVEVQGERWVLTRVAGDPDGPVLAYDRHEWECFLDGAKRGEFDDAAD
jgi:Domain of unknown function (DUF397)